MDPTKNKPVLVQISKSILEGFNEYPDILNHEFVKDQINLVEAAEDNLTANPLNKKLYDALDS